MQKVKLKTEVSVFSLLCVSSFIKTRWSESGTCTGPRTMTSGRFCKCPFSSRRGSLRSCQRKYRDWLEGMRERLERKGEVRSRRRRFIRDTEITLHRSSESRSCVCNIDVQICAFTHCRVGRRSRLDSLNTAFPACTEVYLCNSLCSRIKINSLMNPLHLLYRYVK